MSISNQVREGALRLIERYAPAKFHGDPLPFVLLADQKMKTGLASKTLHRIAARIKEESRQ